MALRHSCLCALNTPPLTATGMVKASCDEHKGATFHLRDGNSFTRAMQRNSSRIAQPNLGCTYQATLVSAFWLCGNVIPSSTPPNGVGYTIRKKVLTRQCCYVDLSEFELHNWLYWRYGTWLHCEIGGWDHVNLRNTQTQLALEEFWKWLVV